MSEYYDGSGNCAFAHAEIEARVRQAFQPVIVTVTPTIMDGTCVRWYLSETAEKAFQPVATASRNMPWYVDDCPPDLRAAADEAYEWLKRNQWVSDRTEQAREKWATHDRPFPHGELKPINKETRDNPKEGK